MNNAGEVELAMRRSTLFCDVAPDVLHRVMQDATLVCFAPGSYLFTAGGAPEYLYVIISGAVKMLASTQGGQESVIELLQPADSFLTAAVLTAKPYLMSAQAIGKVHVVAIPADRLRRLVVAEPQLALTMMASLANQCRQMVLHVKDLRLRTSAQRLGVYLLGLSDTAGGTTAIVLPHVKKLIAARLHMSPENLSRAIQELRAQGVDVVGDEVRLHDIDALRGFCQVDNILDELGDEFEVLTER